MLPAWFDEGNKLRHFTVEVMRRLDGAGIDSFLPDLPGCNESLAPLEQQTLESWRTEAAEAALALLRNARAGDRGGRATSRPTACPAGVTPRSPALRNFARCCERACWARAKRDATRIAIACSA